MATLRIEPTAAGPAETAADGEHVETVLRDNLKASVDEHGVSDDTKSTEARVRDQRDGYVTAAVERQAAQTKAFRALQPPEEPTEASREAEKFSLRSLDPKVRG